MMAGRNAVEQKTTITLFECIIPRGIKLREVLTFFFLYSLVVKLTGLATNVVAAVHSADPGAVLSWQLGSSAEHSPDPPVLPLLVSREHHCLPALVSAPLVLVCRYLTSHY